MKSLLLFGLLFSVTSIGYAADNSVKEKSTTNESNYVSSFEIDNLLNEYILLLGDDPSIFVKDVNTLIRMADKDELDGSLSKQKAALIKQKLYLLAGESSISVSKNYWQTDEKAKVRKILKYYETIISSQRDSDIVSIVKTTIGLKASDVSRSDFAEIVENQKMVLRVKIFQQKVTMTEAHIEAFNLLEQIKSSLYTLDGTNKIVPNTEKSAVVLELINRYNKVVK